MTNINKIGNKKMMQIHIYAEAYTFIDSYLPEFYAQEVVKRLSDSISDIDIETVQSIRNKRGKKNPNFLKVLNTLVELAKENKALIENIKKNINN